MSPADRPPLAPTGAAGPLDPTGREVTGPVDQPADPAGPSTTDLIGQPADPVQSHWRGRFRALGTEVALDLTAPDAAGLARRCQALVEELENRLSGFRPDSDVSRLNRDPGHWLTVAESTDTVLRAALAGFWATDGAFAVARPQPLATGHSGPTGPPGVDGGSSPADWAGRPGTPAGPGLSDGGDRRWRLELGHRLDLGGIAKGHIADQVLARCLRAGASHLLIDLGSSSLALWGGRPAGGPWRVALRNPGGSRDQALGLLEVESGAVSTSGLDERGQHLIDPASGRPARSGAEQVTVLAADGLTAEIWSTALMVAGPDGLLRHYRPGAGFEAVVMTAQSILASPGLSGLRLTGRDGRDLTAPDSVRA
jgi:thiamine biosynthesis lipoprotein